MTVCHNHGMTPTSLKSASTAPSQSLTLAHPWIALVFLSLALSLIVMDGTIINVSLPTIMRDLELTFTQAQWLTTSYALIFSALLITVGCLADNWGRRNILLAGIAIFVLASIIAGTARTFTPLLIARFLQGTGAAAVSPTTLSTVNATFTGKRRMIAFAVWGSVISGMAAVGPLLGGWITTNTTWPWIFLINVPIGIIVALGCIFFVPNTYGERSEHGFDAGGFITSSIGFAALVYALIQGRDLGWWKPINEDWASWPLSPVPLAAALAAVLLGFFIWWERRQLRVDGPHLLNLNLFKLRSFSAGNVAAAAISVGEFGLLFALPLYLQNVRMLTPLQSGGVLAAMAAGAFIAGGSASPLGRLFSATWVARAGLAIESIAVFSLAISLTAHTPIAVIVTALVAYGFGLGLASAQLTSVILVDVPPSTSGQASATQSTTRQVGTALGIALVATFLAASVNLQVQGSLDDVPLPEQARHGIEASVAPSAGASIRALTDSDGSEGVPAELTDQVIDKLSEAFSVGTSRAMGVAGAALGLGCALTFFLPGARKPSGE